MHFAQMLPAKALLDGHVFFWKPICGWLTLKTTQWSEIWDDWHPNLWGWRKLWQNPKYRATDTLGIIAFFEHLYFKKSEAKSRFAGLKITWPPCRFLIISGTQHGYIRQADLEISVINEFYAVSGLKLSKVFKDIHGLLPRYPALISSFPAILSSCSAENYFQQGSEDIYPNSGP